MSSGSWTSLCSYSSWSSGYDSGSGSPPSVWIGRIKMSSERTPLGRIHSRATVNTATQHSSPWVVVVVLSSGYDRDEAGGTPFWPPQPQPAVQHFRGNVSPRPVMWNLKAVNARKPDSYGFDIVRGFDQPNPAHIARKENFLPAQLCKLNNAHFVFSRRFLLPGTIPHSPHSLHIGWQFC